MAKSAEDKAEMNVPPPPRLELRINDVIVFGDDSELHIHVMVPDGRNQDLATAAYYRLLARIADIQTETDEAGQISDFS